MKIIGATVTAVFSLASAFTGTYAWFASNKSVTATGMSISVKALPGTEFEFYYLDHFGSGNTFRNGNYNSTHGIFSGYYSAASNPSFVLIDPDDDYDDVADPRNVEQLWPAHQLTFAVIVTSGSFHGFSLSSWSESRGNNTNKIANNVNVSLSWAINIYGAVFDYSTLDENEQPIDETTIINNGFSDYNTALSSLNDAFDYAPISESHSENPTLPISIVSSNSPSQANHVSVLYFSILFDNSPVTFYTYDEEHEYYVQDNSGDSNCYKGLSLSELSFNLS